MELTKEQLKTIILVRIELLFLFSVFLVSRPKFSSFFQEVTTSTTFEHLVIAKPKFALDCVPYKLNNFNKWDYNTIRVKLTEGRFDLQMTLEKDLKLRKIAKID